MADEIDPTKKVDGQPGQTGPSGPAQIPSDEEVKKAQLQKDLAELEAAKVSANAELQKIRLEKRDAKKQAPKADLIDELVSRLKPASATEVKIDETSPDAQAWIKRIESSVTPVHEELEKEKQEIRSFAISKFLESKPSLAKNPEKLKELVAVYERSHTATERTTEGILQDLEKAYAYTHSSELLEAARQGRVDDAKRNAIFSDIGVSRGSTGYAAPQEAKKEYSEEEKAILARWGQSSAFPKMDK